MKTFKTFIGEGLGVVSGVEYGRGGDNNSYTNREWAYIEWMDRTATNFRVGNDVYAVLLRPFKSGYKLEMAHVGKFKNAIFKKEKLHRFGAYELFNPKFADGDQNGLKVFSHVLTIALEYAAENGDANYFYFDGANEKLQRVYEKIMSAGSTKRLLAQYGYRLETSDEGGMKGFLFVVKDGFELETDFPAPVPPTRAELRADKKQKQKPYKLGKALTKSLAVGGGLPMAADKGKI